MASTGTSLREDPVRLRDAALHRIGLTRRWVITGAAALTAGFAALVSAVLPGKSLGAKATPVAASSNRPVTPSPISPPLPAPANLTQLGVGSPGQSQQSIPPPPAPPAPAPSQSAPAPSESAPAESAPAASAPAPAPSAAVSGGS